MKSFSFKNLLQLVLVCSLAFSLGACKKGNKKGDEQYAGVDGDYVNGTPLPDRPGDGVSFMSSNVDKSQFQPIYFGFDSAEVSSSESGKLESVASFLKSGSNTVILAGFTDERGTEEYNRSLGERRAQAVRNYLISSGANGGNIQTVSFGEEMPASSGSGEAAWSQNRRTEIGVVK
ncbi:MAG TPA: OmpA family protein [Chthoniobacterales bacterium]|jgi:peptidoglycan-associated lipoprotein